MKIRVLGLRKVLREGSRLLGVAQIEINNTLVVEDIRIIEGPSGKFIAMPSKKVNDNYIDLAHPTVIEGREEIQNAVLKAYNEEIFESGWLTPMEITDIRINIIPNEKGVVAIAAVLLNNNFAIKDIQVVKDINEKEDIVYKFFFPARDDGEGNMRNVFYTVDRDFTNKMFGMILDEYKKKINQ